MEGRRRGSALGLSCPHPCPLLTPRAAEFVGFEALLPWDGPSRAETQWLSPAETGEAGGVRAETTQSRTRLAWGHPALPLCQKKRKSSWDSQNPLSGSGGGNPAGFGILTALRAARSPLHFHSSPPALISSAWQRH